LILDNGSRCKITVDGTEFEIEEPQPFDKGFYSKKFNGPGLRYEVGIAIQTGYIVWINGPFKPGEWPDLKIALNDLVYMFEGDERAVADRGYCGHPCYFDTPWRVLDNEQQKMRKKLVRARHETINGLFKNWRILKAVFHHPLCKHCKSFHAVANIVQSQLEQKPTWQVSYTDRVDND
jgi:DDE superfamily endonuclease